VPPGDQTEDQERIEGAVTRPEFTDEDRRRALESLEQTRVEFQRSLGTPGNRAAEVGQCMDLLYSGIGGVMVSCTLPHGHRGAHTNGNTHWTYRSDAAEADKPIDEYSYTLGFTDGRRTATQEGQEPPDLPDTYEADRRGYQRGVIEGIFPRNAKVDVIWPDGTHRYWSTHCRHGIHVLCSAERLLGMHPEQHVLTAVERKPAQCKTCSAPCICDCHKTDTP
jgi:hypothetical protein